MSKYRLQVVDQDGNVAATWSPGSFAEKEFLRDVIENAAEKGIGAFTPLWLVKKRFQDAFEEELMRLKRSVRPT